MGLLGEVWWRMDGWMDGTKGWIRFVAECDISYRFARFALLGEREREREREREAEVGGVEGICRCGRHCCPEREDFKSTEDCVSF